MARFSYLTVASALHDASAVARLTASSAAVLDAHGGSPATTIHEAPAELPFVILVGTGGTEAAVLDAVARRRDQAGDEPVVLIAHARHNSLPASLEALAALRAQGHRGRIVQLTDDPCRVAAGEPAGSCHTSLDDTVADLVAVASIRRSRLGVVGPPSEWLVASVPDAEQVRDRWGIELVPVDIGATIDAHPHTDRAAVEEVAVAIGRTGSPDAELLSAAALHPALTAAIGDAGVDAVTVRCFDYLGRLHTSGCVALAELNDTGVVAGCEGDIASTVAMMLVRALTDRPSWMANPAVIDEVRNEILLAHCTIAPSLVESTELHTHFESGIGVGIRGHFVPGPVTLLRLGGPALDRCWIAEGEIIGEGDSPDLCRTQVTIRLTSGRAGRLLETPLGNHLVLAHGHLGDRLTRWWQLAFGEPPSD